MTACALVVLQLHQHHVIMHQEVMQVAAHHSSLPCDKAVGAAHGIHEDSLHWMLAGSGGVVFGAAGLILGVSIRTAGQTTGAKLAAMLCAQDKQA